jgi:hypothetical protein
VLLSPEGYDRARASGSGLITSDAHHPGAALRLVR